MMPINTEKNKANSVVILMALKIFFLFWDPIETPTQDSAECANASNEYDDKLKITNKISIVASSSTPIRPAFFITYACTDTISIVLINKSLLIENNLRNSDIPLKFLKFRVSKGNFFNEYKKIIIDIKRPENWANTLPSATPKMP